MTSLLSSISAQFGRALIIGTLLPVLLVAALIALLASPYLPVVAFQLEHGSPFQLALFTAIVLGVTTLLNALNTPLTRWYEGYPWRDSYFGRWRTAVHRRRMIFARRRWRGLRTVMYAVGRAEKNTGRLREGGEPTRNKEWEMAATVVNEDFPDDEALLLPTQLGNLVRCFERYPRRQYQMVAVTLWPRLVAVLDKEYAAAIEREKTLFDLLINLSFLGSLAAGAITLAGLWDPGSLNVPVRGVRWLGSILFFGVGGALAYRGALAAARAWGAMVRAAFDLYRRPLLRRLGYGYKLRGLEDERQLWRRISQGMLFGDSPRYTHPGFTQPQTQVIVEPPWLQLTVTRGIKRSAWGRAQITISVGNPAESSAKASCVKVIDHVPAGEQYEWGSAASEGTQLIPTGANPYTFVLTGTLEPGQRRLLAYRTIAERKE
jgi:hypothetical protein